MAPLHRHIAWSYTAQCKPGKLVGLHLGDLSKLVSMPCIAFLPWVLG